MRRAILERVQIQRLREKLGTTLVRAVPRLDIELDNAGGIYELARALE
jgi:hypothetical protein